jgi:hypothetical protein
MEKERYTFRLSQETVGQLDELIKKGLIQNRTDGVTRGVQILHDMEARDPIGMRFQDVIALFTQDPRFMKDWSQLKDGTSIHFYGQPDTKFVIIKHGPTHAEIIRNVDGTKMVTTYKEERWNDVERSNQDQS